MTHLDSMASHWATVFYRGLRDFEGPEEEMIGMFDLDLYRQQEPRLDLVMDTVIEALSDLDFEDKDHARKYFKNLR
jgi:hypothetical protein